MLLMKDRSFLYELRAYLIYVKVGEIGKGRKEVVTSHFPFLISHFSFPTSHIKLCIQHKVSCVYSQPFI